MTWWSSGSYITNSKSYVSVSSSISHISHTHIPNHMSLSSTRSVGIFLKKNHIGLSHIKKCWNMTQLGSLRLQILTSASVCCCVIRHKSELSFQSPNLQMTSIITTTIISYLTICPYFKFNLQITILIVITSVISFL